MTRRELEHAVWRHFPRRSPEHWVLTMAQHHPWTRRFPVYQWEMTGRIDSWGFVDPIGVEVVK